jgi:serine/threonine-protein kinase HipA
MREARVLQMGVPAGFLRELDSGQYEFEYLPGYKGLPVSLTLPIRLQPYGFQVFPPFFEGLLPEGPQLDGLLRKAKLDENDYLGQLLQVGTDLVGSVTVEAL